MRHCRTKLFKYDAPRPHVKIEQNAAKTPNNSYNYLQMLGDDDYKVDPEN